MGNEFKKKIGASILIAVMLLASFGIIGLGVSSELAVQEEVKASGPIQGLKAIELDPVLQASMGDNIPRLTASERITPQSAPPMPEVNGIYPVVDTTRCVLAEFGSGIDNGSFVPSYLYAQNQAMATYTTSEVATMQLNSWGDCMINPAYFGWQDKEYSPGDNMFTGGYCDAMVREASLPPYGLDCFPAYLWPASLDPVGEKLCNAGIWSVDGGVDKYDGSGAYYNDADWTWDGRWDDAGGSGAECVQPAINARLGVPCDFTMTLNGTFDDPSDWGNVSLTVSAINDITWDSNAYIVSFWVVNDYDVVEVRNNPYNNDGTAGDGPSNKNYYIRNSMQQWMGIDDMLDGFLENRGEVISYQDISFNRRVTPAFGLRNDWNAGEVGMIASLYDETTMEVLQTVYYEFGSIEPDLAVTPVDVFFDNVVYVVNETVVGPTFDGQTGPIFLANGNIIDCSLYVDIFGEWIPIEEGPDYTLNYATGQIDTPNIEPYEAGWFFHAYYNYTIGSPSVGDTVPMDITISNAGNGIANAVVVGLYDGDPTNGGVLIDTHAAGNIAGNTAYNFIYDWDTTGYEGFKSFCVVPDHLDAITESNENNNIAAYDIYIAPPDDVGVLDLLTFEDGLTYEYGIYDIEAIIGNYGTSPQPPFDVNCQVEHLGSAVYLLNDNVEGGALPGYTPDAPWAPGTLGANSPTTSWDFGQGGYPEFQDSKLTYGPFDLTGAFASASWKWWHSYSWEAPNWDGGVVEASADGVAWDRLVPVGGYPGTIAVYDGSNPLETQDAFIGAVGWEQRTCDLSAYLGDGTVWIRYWAGTDSFPGGGWGWRVDDIMIAKITAGLGVLYDVTQPTTMNPMNQFDSEILTWNYNFDMEAMYRVSVTTLLATDAVVTNDQIVVDITTANIRAPFPPTDLTSQAGGAGTTFYAQATSDIPVTNNGITNDFSTTNMPADAVTEDITELWTAGGVAVTDRANNDYIDAADGEGTVTGGSLANVNDGDNNQYYAIQETVAGGGPNARSVLGWIFEIPVTGAADVEFFVQAYHDPDVADGDDYNFDYSTVGVAGPWTPMVTVTATTDPGTYQSFSDATLDAFSGTLYIRVQDTDRTNGNNNVFSNIYIDDMYIDSVTPGVPHYSLEHQWQFANVPAGDTHMFYATTGFAGDDNFAYYYSTTGAFAGEEVLMATDVTPGLDQFSYDLGAGYSGAFYVAVRDTDSLDVAIADVVSIDEMYVETVITTSPNDLVLTWTLSPDDGAGSNDVQGYNIYKADAASGEFYEGPYNLFDTVGAGTSMWADTGAMLVADNAWYYIEATDPLYTSTQTGNVSKYDPMPLTANLLADGVNPWIGPLGTPTLTLTCTISDNTTVNEYNTLVTGAEWYDTVDLGPGSNNPIATPVDGTWDGPYELINEILDISAWGAGLHTIYVRANSDTGWGAPVSVDVTLTEPPYDIELIGVLPGEWAFVSFPIEASGNIETILDDSIIGDGGTTWDVAKWYDATDPADPWKTHRIGVPGNDLLTIDNTMGVWLHITANGGNNALTVSQTAGYSAVAVDIFLETGWNMVGYPSATPRDAAATLPVEADFIAVHNPAMPYLIEDFPVVPGAVTMSEGNGYWVHVTGPCWWPVAP